jgi:hypothetical protein
MMNVSGGESWQCFARPAELKGKRCSHINASGGKKHKGLIVCEKCSCTKIASDARKREGR